MATPTYELISSQVLSSSAASVTFSSIPATYRDLVLIVEAGCGGNGAYRTRLNSDSGSNYSRVRMQGDGSSATSGTATDTSLESEARSDAKTLFQLQIMDYSATDKHKSVLGRHHYIGGFSAVTALAYRWANTAAVTSVEISNNTGTNFTAGSTFYLYGIAS